MDLIFLCGASAVGKSTLAKRLCEHYRGVLIEQNMVPAFAIPEGCPDEGAFEERVCWGNMLVQIEYFFNSRFRNIIALDFDDIRVCELPAVFKGYDFIILRLFSSDGEQIVRQMELRRATTGGLYAPEDARAYNAVIARRPLLPNEATIDISGKNEEEIFAEAKSIIDGFVPQKDYEYFPDNSEYLSWVKSRRRLPGGEENDKS